MRIVGRGFLNAKYQKSIKFDEYTLKIIESYRGRNFSDKLRNYIYDVEHGLYPAGKK